MLILPNFIFSYPRQLTLRIQLWNSNWPNMQHFLCCMTVVKLRARHQWRFDDIWPDPAVLLAVADVFFAPQAKQTHTATATYASRYGK